MKQVFSVLCLAAALAPVSLGIAEDALPPGSPPPLVSPQPQGPTAPQLAPPPASAAEPRLEVVLIQLTAKDGLVDVRYRLENKERISNQPDSTFLLDEATGEKFPVRGVAKIGNLAPERINPDPGLLSYVLFNNRGLKITHGSVLTVVIGGARQEHVKVP